MVHSDTIAGFTAVIVEDNFLLARDTKEALEEAGALVVGVCRDPGEVRDLLARSRPDCAVVDLNLGRGCSSEPALALLAAGVKVLIVTGYDAGSIPEDIRHLPFLCKPADDSRLVAALAKCVAAP